MQYKRGAILFFCIPVLIAMAMALLMLWERLVFGQRLLRAEQQHLEVERLVEKQFEEWQKNIVVQNPVVGDRQERACGPQHRFRCGYVVKKTGYILVYVALSDTILRQRVLLAVQK